MLWSDQWIAGSRAICAFSSALACGKLFLKRVQN